MASPVTCTFFQLSSGAEMTLTEKQAAEILDEAQKPLPRFGAWQRYYADRLIAGEVVTNPLRDLRGRAASYVGRYSSSWSSVLEILRKHGYYVVVCPGAHGGQWSATYRAYPGPAMRLKRVKERFGLAA